MELFFFALLGVLTYIFVVYPAGTALLALLARKKPLTNYEPTVAVLIPAANECHRIAAKLKNTLSSDYPAGKMEIIVASDGSTDGTDEVVRSFEDPRITLISLGSSRGKANAINRLSLAAKAEILVMSDADVLISPNAVRALAGHFADPKVGAVCGLRSSLKENVSDSSLPSLLYNHYESAIKRGEESLGRTLGGDGSLYALRRECFRPLPEQVPDDFVNALRVLEQGLRVDYERRAVSREELANSLGGVYMRRRRTVARGVRGLWSVRGLLNPLRFPLVAFLLFSHKILRWCAGFMMLALLIVNVLLIQRPGFAWFFAAQALFYGLSFLPGLVLPGVAGKARRMMRYFILSNLAASTGVIDVLLGRDWSSWEVQRADKGA